MQPCLYKLNRTRARCIHHMQLLLNGRAQFGTIEVGKRSYCYQAEQSCGSIPEKPAHPVSIFGFRHLCIADDTPLATLAALNPAHNFCCIDILHSTAALCLYRMRKGCYACCACSDRVFYCKQYAHAHSVSMRALQGMHRGQGSTVAIQCSTDPEIL